MSDYSTKIKDNDMHIVKHQVWLVISNLGFVIKKLDADLSRIQISDITLESHTLSMLIASIESEWNILCSYENLVPIYSIADVDSISYGYLLRIQNLHELDTLMTDNKIFEILSFDVIESCFDGKNMSPELSEGLTALFAKVGKN